MGRIYPAQPWPGSAILSYKYAIDNALRVACGVTDGVSGYCSPALYVYWPRKQIYSITYRILVITSPAAGFLRYPRAVPGCQCLQPSDAGDACCIQGSHTYIAHYIAQTVTMRVLFRWF